MIYNVSYFAKITRLGADKKEFVIKLFPVSGGEGEYLGGYMSTGNHLLYGDSLEDAMSFDTFQDALSALNAL